MKSSSRFVRFSAIPIFALLISSALGLQNQATPTEQQRGLLFADLWMQTSAEYVACCLQTYRLAGEHLQHEVARSALKRPHRLPTCPIGRSRW